MLSIVHCPNQCLNYRRSWGLNLPTVFSTPLTHCQFMYWGDHIHTSYIWFSLHHNFDRSTTVEKFNFQLIVFTIQTLVSTSFTLTLYSALQAMLSCCNNDTADHINMIFRNRRSGCEIMDQQSCANGRSLRLTSFNVNNVSGESAKSFVPVVTIPGDKRACAVDEPSSVLNLTGVDGGFAEMSQCAMQCTRLTDCTGYNVKLDTKLCQIYSYEPTRFALVPDCEYRQVPTSQFWSVYDRRKVQPLSWFFSQFYIMCLKLHLLNRLCILKITVVPEYCSEEFHFALCTNLSNFH